MVDASSLLKNEEFLKELKPCRFVLDFICKETTENDKDAAYQGVTPSQIAKSLYKVRYEDFDKQLKEFEKLDDIIEYKKKKKEIVKKKKLPLQVVSQKCRKLVGLGMISEVLNERTDRDMRKTFYYPTKLGKEVYHIYNEIGFPTTNRYKKNVMQNIHSSISKQEFIQQHVIIQHSLNLKDVLRRLIQELPFTSKSGIYISQDETTNIPYKGEEFYVERDQSHLYRDFFDNHIKFDKNLLEKIEQIKLKCNKFWKNKNEIYEEMWLDLNNYFSTEISGSSDVEPLDGDIRNWIFEGATNLAQDNDRIFKNYYLNFNVESKTLDRDWGYGSRKGERKWPKIDIIEYSVCSHRFFSSTSFDVDRITKSNLEKKLMDYMEGLHQRAYFQHLIKNIKLLGEISNFIDEIKDALQKHMLLHVFFGDCEYLDTDIET